MQFEAVLAAYATSHKQAQAILKKLRDGGIIAVLFLIIIITLLI